MAAVWALLGGGDTLWQRRGLRPNALEVLRMLRTRRCLLVSLLIAALTAAAMAVLAFVIYFIVREASTIASRIFFQEAGKITAAAAYHLETPRAWEAGR